MEQSESGGTSGRTTVWPTQILVDFNMEDDEEDDGAEGQKSGK